MLPLSDRYDGALLIVAMGIIVAVIVRAVIVAAAIITAAVITVVVDDAAAEAGKNERKQRKGKYKFSKIEHFHTTSSPVGSGIDRSNGHAKKFRCKLKQLRRSVTWLTSQNVSRREIITLRH